MKLLASLAVATTVVGISPAFAADYALKQKFPIAGDGGWDYLTYDSHANRLFISRATHVQVVDPDKGKVLADIPDTPGVHGIALADDLGKGFTSNGRDDSVTVFDLKTLGTIAKIKTEGGRNPDFIAYDAVSKRVFTFNGASANASVIDAAGQKLVATIPLDGKPEAAVADGSGLMYVDIEDKNEVTVIDTRKAVVVKSWPIAGCEEPAALALDKAARKLFVGCHNRKLAIVDTESGKVAATLPIGAGVDAAAFDPAAKLAFSSQGDGTLTIVREGSPGAYEVAQDVSTQRGARTMALNPANHDVYLVTAEFEEAPAAAGEKRPRRTMKPGSFVLLVVSARS